MKKQVIRLTEGDLHKIIKESVNKVLNEIGNTKDWQYKLGALNGRNIKRMYDSIDANNVNDAEKYRRQSDEVIAKSDEHCNGFDDMFNAFKQGENDYYVNNMF
jgi:hypothetical protein